MIYAVLGLVLVVLIYAPSVWVRYVLNSHSKTLADLPGTGGELAQHLVARFQLEGVVVAEGKPNEDHYSPDERTVRLSPKVFKGRSLTAVAVAAHEVGHAIQFTRNEPVSHLRKKYFRRAILIQRLGTGLLVCLPLITAVFRVPHIIVLTGLIGVGTMFVSVLMYVAILPEEFDASFGKALPILEEGEYISPAQVPAVRQVLRACAYTYVASALADILSLWRWLALLRGIR